MDELAPWVNDYIGIPFLSGGRDRSGVDCYGLVRLILAEQYGYNLPVLAGEYTNCLSLAETVSLFRRQVPILTEELEGPKVGAVALIQLRRLPCHLGLYCGEGCIIHARNNLGAVLEKIDSRLFPGKIVGWHSVGESYRAAGPVQR